jgi:transcriptional regulator with XRE-family HTH domain
MKGSGMAVGHAEHDFSSKLRFLTFVLVGEEEDLVRYAGILLHSLLADLKITQTELAEKIGCSQSTISKDLPNVWRLWDDADELYRKFHRQLEYECCPDDTQDEKLRRDALKFHLQVLKYLFQKKSAEEIRVLTKTPNIKVVMAALLRIEKVRRDFGAIVKQHA